MHKSNRGFTLIELLVVVAIIALLISILLPALGSARESSKRAVCMSQVRGLAQAMLLYATDNRDMVPMHQGVEPSYVYVDRGDSPALEWHLAQLLLKYLGSTQNIPRSGPNGTFTDQDFEITAPLGKMFHCPSTGNYSSKVLGKADAWWANPTQFGAFMDYAQMWNFVGPGPYAPTGGIRDDAVLPNSQDGFFRVFDDNQDTIVPLPEIPVSVYRLPFKLDRVPPRLPNSDENSRVPIIQDYIVSVGKSAAEVKSLYQSKRLKPTAANHLPTGRAEGGSGGRAKGANIGYEDGSVRFRNTSLLRPRLMIDRIFPEGSTRPTYWW